MPVEQRENILTKREFKMIKKGEKVVIAIGGNALIKKEEKPTIANQLKNTRKMMEKLLPLIKKNKIIITHGNGTQVGNILIRVEEALGKAYDLPLDVCVAESQGEIGYILEQSLQNVLNKKKIKKPIVCVLTQVLVDKNDPAFKRPTKPIGPFYNKKQAMLLKKKGFTIINQKGRGWRKVVPSPKPIKIENTSIINMLLKKEIIVIAAGGGGIPIIKEKKSKKIKGIPAVIDKDHASACLARAVKAKHLIILTGESSAYLNYKKKNQKPLNQLTLKQAKNYLEEGCFPEGSMGPKIEAAMDFIKKGGKSAIITSAEALAKALEGKAGTHITK